jgi:uncharacterized membrane-anchored protein
MKNSIKVNPLLIAGLVLLVNAFVAVLVAASFGMYELLGVVIGCLGAGIGLTVTGLIRQNKQKEKSQRVLN